MRVDVLILGHRGERSATHHIDEGRDRINVHLQIHNVPENSVGNIRQMQTTVGRQLMSVERKQQIGRSVTTVSFAEFMQGARMVASLI